MIYKDVFSALNKGKVKYLVIGGVAVNLYGFPRTTLDLDLVIALDQQNRTSFFQVMKKLKFKTKRTALASKLILGESPPGKIKVVTFYRDEFELIDVFIQSPIDFDKAYKKRKLFKAENTTISTIPYNVLIAMKEETDREKDLLDVGYLEKIRKTRKK